MQNFFFHNPTQVIFGKKTIPRIGRVLRLAGVKNVLLVAGLDSIRQNGVYDTIVGSLHKNGLAWTEFWGVQPNPTLGCVREIVNRGREDRTDAVLAVGGGSVIDAAKAAAAGILGEDVWSYVRSQKDVREAHPLFTVLTRSGSGSEMNDSALLTFEAERKKWGLRGPALFPKVTIIDPRVQFSLPWRLTALGAVDALAHLFEHYALGLAEPAPFIPALAVNEALMRSILENLAQVQKNGRDYAARAGLVWAASLGQSGLAAAGLGGGDWALHCLAHSISAVFPAIAHSEAVSALFPAWLGRLASLRPDIAERFARSVLGAANADAGQERLTDLLASWAAPTRLGHLGLGLQDIEAIAANLAVFAEHHGIPGRLSPLGYEETTLVLRSAV